MSLPILSAQGLAQTLGEVGTSSKDASVPAGVTFQPQSSVFDCWFHLSSSDILCITAASQILMKASYINLGKTATKALPIAGDISSVLFPCSRHVSELLRAGTSEGNIVLQLFTLPQGTGSKDHLPLKKIESPPQYPSLFHLQKKLQHPSIDRGLPSYQQLQTVCVLQKFPGMLLDFSTSQFRHLVQHNSKMKFSTVNEAQRDTLARGGGRGECGLWPDIGLVSWTLLLAVTLAPV